MTAGICTALASEKRRAEGPVREQNSNPTNLLRVPGDDKDAQMIRPEVRRDKEKSVFLRIVTFRSSYQLFAVAKGNLGFAALVLHVKFLRFAVFGTGNEIPGKENCFQVLHVDFHAFAACGVLLGKKAEAFLLRREIVDVAFHAAAIEEGYYCLIPVTKKVSSRHGDSLLLGSSIKNVTSSGKNDPGYQPISPLRTD